jgi:tripartite-type tricarboxylate transporter receptor subunit TctC
MTRRRAISTTAAFGIGAGGLGAPTIARAQERALRIIVPFAPGGATDIVARVLAKDLAETAGIKAIIDNKPGANGIIGVDLAAKAAPDGKTIVLSALGALVVNPHMQKMPYDPLADLVPITHAVNNPLSVVVRKDLSVQSVAELVALARERPGKVTAGSSGSGSVVHVAIEQLKLETGVDITHVPYKGEGPAVADLSSGQIDMSILTIVAVQGQVSSGAIRMLAVASAARSPAVPDMPTVAEAGVPGYEAQAWLGFLAPARTPPEAVARLNTDITRALKKPEVVADLRSRGSDVVAGSADEFATFLRREHAKYGRIVEAAKITLD